MVSTSYVPPSISITMPTYKPYGPFVVPTANGQRAKYIEAKKLREFWNAHEEVGDRRGCYVFGIRTGRGITPMYVGKATRQFRSEVFTPHKMAKYQRALSDCGKGTPVLFFLSAPARKGAPNLKAIHELEEFLIQTAVSRNEDLLNVKGTKRATWSIAGIVRSPVGKPSSSARQLRRALGL